MQQTKKSTLNKLRAIQNDLNRSRNCLYSLNVARQKLSSEEYLPLLTWALAAKRKGMSLLQNLTQSLYPKRLPQLKAIPVFTEIEPDQELAWCCALTLLNHSNINEFISTTENLERNLLENKLNTCLQQAEEIEKIFGKSIWLIETKTAILQCIGGIESQKEYLREIKDEGASNIPWLAATYSQRNEETTTYFRFANQLIEFLGELESEDQRNYLIYRSLDFLPGSSRGLANILRYESNASILDLYTTLIRVLQECISEPKHELKNAAISCLESLSTKIKDSRITRMLFIAGKSESPDQYAFSEFKNLDEQSRADNTSQLEGIAISDWPFVWQKAALSLSKSAIENQNQDTLQNQTLASLCKIYKDGSSADNIISKELKKCLNYRHFQFSKSLDEILWQELSSEPFNSPQKGLIRFINTKYLDPELLIHLPEDRQKKYAELLTAEYPHSQIVKNLIWRSDRTETQIEIADASSAITASEKALLAGQHGTTLKIAYPILESVDNRIRRIAARIISKALSHQESPADLIDFVARQCTVDPNIINLLPIPLCTEKLDKVARKRLAHKITTPVILSHYSINYDEEHDKHLAYAYEDFLIKNDLRKPSEIPKISEKLDRALLIHYLRYVCTPEIMKISTEFTGSSAVQDERLAVCSLLLEIDPQNSKEYESEIREITRAQIIRKGVRHVEQSKMSIDTATIRKWADKKFKESFLRYKGLVKAGFSPLAGFQQALLQSLSAGKPMPKEFFEVPTDEAGSLLKDIVYAIIQECTISSLHGLDCYLSMRVRHGAFSGQLRGPLEAEKVITQKQANQQSYAPNDYWLKQLHYLPSAIRDTININLCTFSAEYDNLIERTKNQLIQINTKDKPEGIFNISFTYTDLRLMAIDMTDETSFDDFFDLCIDLFWTRVEACLTNIHIAIDSKIKPEINRLFKSLQDSIDISCGGSYPTPELNRAVRTAQTNAIQALEQLKDWFRIPTPRSEPPFEIEELIDIGLQCVQRIHKGFTPRIKKEIPELPPLANALTLFSDIFFILFDNIRKYAETGQSPNIKIKITRESDEVAFLVSNELGASTFSEEALEKIQEIKTKISKDTYHSSVKSEGGTGLIKLRKLIGTNQELDFGYNEDNEFFVKFNLSLHEIEL